MEGINYDEMLHVELKDTEDGRKQIKLPDFKATIPYGYAFNGWFTKEDCSHKIGDAGETVTIDADDPLMNELKGHNDPWTNKRYVSIYVGLKSISNRKDACADMKSELCPDRARFAQAILINDGNKDKINAAIDNVQKNNNVRTADYSDAKLYADRFDNKIYMIGKKAADGCEIAYVSGSTIFPNSYLNKAHPLGTVLYLMNRKGKWYLIGADRTWCNRSFDCDVYLPETAKAALVERARRDL